MDLNKYIINGIVFEVCCAIGRTYCSIINNCNGFGGNAGSLLCSRG
jgi:hypothetical protein